MKIFNLPDLGEGLPDAEIKEWYVKEGDTVALDQPIVAMETAKALVDVPAPQAGKIKKLYGAAGDIITTGSPLVEFESAETPVKQSAPQGGATVAGKIEVGETVIEENPAGVIPTTSNAPGIKAIPAIRALAKKLDVDLTTIKGSGPGGAITKEDVEKAASVTDRPTSHEDYEIAPVRGVRRAMAAAMSKSHAEVVPVTLVDDADIHSWPEKTDITYRIIHAIIAACKKQPALNAHFNAEKLERKIFKSIHLGLALDSEEGLFVPVIHDVQAKDKTQIRSDIERFKTQIKDRSISQEELGGSTIQLSNFGMFAGRYANPVIVPPIVSIIGIGGIREEVKHIEGKFESHRIMPISLTIDHRAVTGGEAARFLKAMIDDLQLTSTH